MQANALAEFPQLPRKAIDFVLRRCRGHSEPGCMLPFERRNTLDGFRHSPSKTRVSLEPLLYRLKCLLNQFLLMADQAQVSDSREMEPIQAAWTVMNRLFEYLRRGSQPLPISEFPLLV